MVTYYFDMLKVIFDYFSLLRLLISRTPIPAKMLSCVTFVLTTRDSHQMVRQVNPFVPKEVQLMQIDRYLRCNGLGTIARLTQYKGLQNCHSQLIVNRSGYSLMRSTPSLESSMSLSFPEWNR